MRSPETIPAAGSISQRLDIHIQNDAWLVRTSGPGARIVTNEGDRELAVGEDASLVDGTLLGWLHAAGRAPALPSARGYWCAVSRVASSLPKRQASPGQRAVRRFPSTTTKPRVRCSGSSREIAVGPS